MRKQTIPLIRMVLAAVILPCIAATSISCNPSAQPLPEKTTDFPANSSCAPITVESDPIQGEETALPPEDLEDWFVPRFVPELDEGNEIYLDADVIGKLTALEGNGEEDLVNAILDGEILLINHFVRHGYSEKALSQIQRFYYVFYDRLKNETFDTLAEKIGQCIDADGTSHSAFAEQAALVFGWTSMQDYSYIFEPEVSE